MGLPPQISSKEAYAAFKVFWEKALENGSGLAKFRTKEQAEEFLPLLQALLPDHLACCLVREKELNVYTITKTKKS